MVWSKSATELERINFLALKKMGVDNSALIMFNELDHYTLSEKTLMVLALQSLEVEGRLLLIQMLLEVEDRDEAMLMVRLVAVFGSHHRLVSPIEKLEIRNGLAVGYTNDGSLVLPLVLDYLHWAPEITDVILSDEFEAEDRTLWIGGEASAIAKSRLAVYDWKLEENFFETFRRLEEHP